MRRKEPISHKFNGEPVYAEDTNTEIAHRSIAYILTFLILIILFFYNYFAFNLPYRTKIIHITNQNGKELYMSDIIKNYNNTKNTVYDFNKECRDKNIKVSGTIEIGKIEVNDSGGFKIYSKGSYNQYKASITSAEDYGDCDGEYRFRDIVIYVDCTKEYIEKIKSGDKIKFMGDFDNINDQYLIVTQGEVSK